MDVRIFRNCFAARDYYFKKDENEKKNIDCHGGKKMYDLLNLT